MTGPSVEDSPEAGKHAQHPILIQNENIKSCGKERGPGNRAGVHMVGGSAGMGCGEGQACVQRGVV